MLYRVSLVLHLLILTYPPSHHEDPTHTHTHTHTVTQLRNQLEHITIQDIRTPHYSGQLTNSGHLTDHLTDQDNSLIRTPHPSHSYVNLPNINFLIFSLHLLYTNLHSIHCRLRIFQLLGRKVCLFHVE